MSAGVREGLEWTVFDTPVTLAEVTAPTIVEDNTLKLYAKDKSGVSALFYKGDDEVEKDLSGGLTGSGTSGHVAFWTGATVLSGESNLFWDSTNNRLGIGTATPSDPLQVVGVGKFLGRLQLTGTTILPTTRGGVEMGHAEGTWGGFIETFGEGGTTYDRFTFKCNNWELNTGVVPAITLSVSAAGVVNVSNLTASQFVTTDASKNLVSNDHLGAADPHTGYRLESADHSHQSTGLQAGQLDHGLALTGLTDDDHSAYLLASDATSRALFATNWLDLTDGGATTLHSHAGGVTDHGALTGLSDDDHTQYALLAGRSGGQTLIGGTAAGDGLFFQTSSNVTSTASRMGFSAGTTGAFAPVQGFHFQSGQGQWRLTRDTSGGASTVTMIMSAAAWGPDGAAGVGTESNNDFVMGAFNKELARVTGASATALNLVISTGDTNMFFLRPGSGRAGLVFEASTALGSLQDTTAGLFASVFGTNTEMMSIDESNRVRSLTWPRDVRVATQFDKTSDTTLANVTNLTHNVNAGKTYSFEARLFTTSAASGGVKAAISGTATVTSIVYEGLTIDAGVTTQSRTTTLGNAVGAVTAVAAALMIIKGTVVVNAAGTLTVQFAQNASDAGASSVLINSSFVVDQLP